MSAQQPHHGLLILLQWEYIKITKPSYPRPKSPVVAPTVYIDGNVLTFETPCDGCTLQLVDEDGDVVYTTVIPEDTTTLTLPADLEGIFELQIIRGDWMFYGEVEL
ncbi:MAG: hypothetical protein IJV20_11710 [Prevotella sp.]|nr:hypothetical protein [Prevotella sp.]